MVEKVYKKTNAQDIVYGAIVVFYKKEREGVKYLVVENSETGNISIVSGAQETEDRSTIDTAQRETQEELNITPEKYVLKPTVVRHEFVFGPKKKERAGKMGCYHVFIGDGANIDIQKHTTELKMTKRMTKEEVMSKVSFDDLKIVFEKAIGEI